MKILLFTLFIVAITFSCTSKSQTYHIETKDAIDNGFTITINNEIVNDYSFVESAKYVFLESTHPIAGIDRLILHNDTIIILDKKEESVHLYNAKGAFILKINNKGKGPGEYNNLDDVAVDHDAKNLIVLDRNSRKLLYYGFDGVFQKEIDLKWGLYNKVAYIDNHIFLHNSSANFYSKDQQEYYHSLLRYDLKSDSLVGYFSGINSASHIGMENKAFFRNGLNLYYINDWSFDIYKIQPSKTSRLFTLSFRNNAHFLNYLEGISASDINNLLNTQYAFDIRDICITEKFISFKYNKEKNTFQVVYDKDQSKIVFHSNNFALASGELLNKNILYYQHPQFCHNEELISVVQPLAIKNSYNNIIINNAPKSISKPLDRIRNMDISDNPILIFYELSHD